MQRLGIDLGTDSIGWVLYRLDAGGAPEAIVGSGVRIFSGGLEQGQSKAKVRREARGARRGYRRRRWRVRRLERDLTALGLLPEDADERDRVRRLDPLRLRARALDEPLEPYELGRVLRAFVKRRGFQSNRKADRASKERRDESKKVREANEALAGEMRESGARTLGEHLWRLRRRGKATRARLRDGAYDGPYPTRSMIRGELEAIRGAQAPHHPGIADASWETLIETILHQRCLKRVEVGRCTLLPEEKRIHRAHPLFQRYRILDEVSHLRIMPPGESRRPLTDEERRAVLKDLGARKERKFADFHRLGFPEGTRVSLWSEAREKIDGDLTAAALRQARRFGKAWDGDELDFARQQEIVERLLDVEDAAEIEAWLRERCGLNEDAARAVASAPLPAGTGHLSKAAIKRLLPHMENGIPFHEAALAAGLGPHSDFRGDGSADRLPYYGEAMPRRVRGGGGDGGDVERHGRVANPGVHVALNQLRLLVNALIDRHGKPDEVVVEVARELRHTPKERGEYRLRQGKNRQRREREEEETGRELTDGEWEKLRIWRTQGRPGERICPYTGEALSREMALSDRTEIDHILPRSRSYDDTQNNKVVVTLAANREKGDRTPFEAWGRTARWPEIVARVDALWGGRYGKNRRWRFDEDAMEQLREDGDFQARQLTDTAYVSKIAREYLESIVPSGRVWVIRGQQTALLRRHWGLDDDETEKDRSDHRHHLVDAAVIGATDRSALLRIAGSAQPGGDFGRIDPPWPAFRQAVEDARERCTVSHRASPFRLRPGIARGQLHNKTPYRVVSGPDADGRMRLAEGGKQPRTHHKDSLVKIDGKVFKTDGNAYMDVWMLPDGKTTGETVSRFNAHKPDYRSKVKCEHPTARKLMRLHLNDMVAIGEGTERRIMRVQELSGQTIRAVDHNQSGMAKGMPRFQKSAGQVIQAGLRKVSVDVIGRVRDGGPFDREERGKRD